MYNYILLILIVIYHESFAQAARLPLLPTAPYAAFVGTLGRVPRQKEYLFEKQPAVTKKEPVKTPEPTYSLAALPAGIKEAFEKNNNFIMQYEGNSLQFGGKLMQFIVARQKEPASCGFHTKKNCDGIATADLSALQKELPTDWLDYITTLRKTPLIGAKIEEEKAATRQKMETPLTQEEVKNLREKLNKEIEVDTGWLDAEEIDQLHTYAAPNAPYPFIVVDDVTRLRGNIGGFTDKTRDGLIKAQAHVREKNDAANTFAFALGSMSKEHKYGHWIALVLSSYKGNTMFVGADSLNKPLSKYPFVKDFIDIFATRDFKAAEITQSLKDSHHLDIMSDIMKQKKYALSGSKAIPHHPLSTFISNTLTHLLLYRWYTQPEIPAWKVAPSDLPTRILDNTRKIIDTAKKENIIDSPEFADTKKDLLTILNTLYRKETITVYDNLAFNSKACKEQLKLTDCQIAQIKNQGLQLGDLKSLDDSFFGLD